MEDSNGITYIEERAPCHVSLLTPMLMAGVPRQLAIMNGSLALAIVGVMAMYWSIFLFVAAHFAFRYLAKIDPWFFDTFRDYVNDKPYYDT
jgi:type IV secretion system protein VirB3